MSIKGLYLFQYLLLGTGAFTFSPYDSFFFSLSCSLHFLSWCEEKGDTSFAR